MKKFLIAFFSFIILSVSVNAQSADMSKADKAAQKEAKEKLKQKQNEDIDNALSQIGITKEVAKSFKDVMQTYSSRSSEVRKNTSLTDEEKEKQLKAITEEKNGKLAEIIGADKYKEFNKIRKQQKEKEASVSANN